VSLLHNSLRGPALATLVAALALTACAGREERPQLVYEERPVELLYNTGANRLDRGLWNQAVDYFAEVERQHPYSVWARRSILMTAYAQYQANDDAEAIASADRFLTQGSSAVWTVQLVPQGAETALRIGPGFARDITIETLQPEPLRTTNAAEGLRLVFATPPGSGRLTVRLTGRTERAGLIEADFAAGGEGASITHFVYP